MGTTETGVLSEIIAGTQNDLLIFFVLITVAMIVVMLPLYRFKLNERAERRKHENEHIRYMGQSDGARLDKFIQREAHIINVIKENSEVISGLKAAFESSGINTYRALERIQDDQRLIKEELVNIRNTVDGL